MSSFATEKPFAGVQRQRHDGTNGRVALHGHTARKSCDYSATCDRHTTTAKLSRQLPRCRNHDYLDKDKAYGTQPTSRLAEPYALTALELNGIEVDHSLQKANAWAAVPSLLAENCVGLPSSRKLASGKVETQYQLIPEGLLMPDPAVAAAEHKLSTHLYEIKRHRPQLQAVFPTEPPEGVTSPLLKATLKCRGVHVPQSAIVRVNVAQPVESAALGEPQLTSLASCGESSQLLAALGSLEVPPPACAKVADHASLAAKAHPHTTNQAHLNPNQAHASFFDVARAKGTPLEIDLGALCAISAVSTMGRHPSTRLYPRTGIELRGGRVSQHLYEDWDAVEDGDYLPGYKQGEKYKGPYWTVRTSASHDRHASPTSCLTHTPAWVKRYELWWRADGGRQWHKLGCLAGNTDDVGEVAHSLDDLGPGRRGLVARYLRIVPLEGAGGGAMRVGVYGERLGWDRCAPRSRKHDVAELTRGVSIRHSPYPAETETETELITYTLTSSQASASAAPRPRTHVRDGLGLGDNGKHDGYGKGRRLRAPSKRSLRGHAAEMLQEWRDRDLDDCHGRGHEYYYEYIGLLPVGKDGRLYWPSTEEATMGRAEREELELAMALSMSMAQEHAATSEGEGESEGEGSDAVTVEQMAEVVAREWDLECRSGSEEGGERLSPVSAEEDWVVVEAEANAH